MATEPFFEVTALFASPAPNVTLPLAEEFSTLTAPAAARFLLKAALALASTESRRSVVFALMFTSSPALIAWRFPMVTREAASSLI